MDFSSLLDSHFYLPIVVTILSYAGIWVVKNILVARLKKISARTSTYLDDIFLGTLEKTKHFFMIGASIFIGFQGLPWDKTHGHIADRVFMVLFSIQFIIWGFGALNAWFDLTLKRKGEADPSLKTTFGFVKLFLRFFLLVLVFLFILNNLGVNITTFITGLGVGGVAIALATQNILGDLFSSLSIVLDKPFIVGDFISLGEWSGTVENVGLKTTRLRSISGEQIVLSNSDLLSSKIRNFKRMNERRVVSQIGVTYDTSREAIMAAPKLLEEIIREEPMTRFDRAHFMRYGASSLDFEVVYYVLSPNYNDFMDAQQRILLKIHEAFEKNKLDFAYPTQRLLVEDKTPRNLEEQTSGRIS